MALLRLFVRQDLRQRFSGNVLGIAWAGLSPLLQLALFALVFVHIFKARVPGLTGSGYVAFLALGGSVTARTRLRIASAERVQSIRPSSGPRRPK
jgi:ABC-type polysaccharide/polyol phosphate export permease